MTSYSVQYRQGTSGGRTNWAYGGTGTSTTITGLTTSARYCVRWLPPTARGPVATLGRCVWMSQSSGWLKTRKRSRYGRGAECGQDQHSVANDTVGLSLDLGMAPVVIRKLNNGEIDMTDTWENALSRYRYQANLSDFEGAGDHPLDGSN